MRLTATYVPKHLRKGEYDARRPVFITSGSGQRFALTKAEAYKLLQELKQAYKTSTEREI